MFTETPDGVGVRHPAATRPVGLAATVGQTSMSAVFALWSCTASLPTSSYTLTSILGTIFLSSPPIATSSGLCHQCQLDVLQPSCICSTHFRMKSPFCAGKQERRMLVTAEGERSTVCHSSEVCSWQWTPLWCLRCGEMANHSEGHQTETPWLSVVLGKRRRPPTPNLCDQAVEHAGCFGLEVGGRWSQEAKTFVQLLAQARARSEPPLTRRRMEQAWRLRWYSVLSCAAARAFAASMLELRGGHGGDGQVPTAREVEREQHHAGLCG